MSIGFASVPASASSRRTLEAAEWSAVGAPLLRDPRALVKDLCARHLPAPPAAVIGVLSPDHRLVASASFTLRAGTTDGWDHRNDLLRRLRSIIPHDLRRRSPVRTGVLLLCREDSSGWTEADGPWMWALRDACTLHGLRCGAYVTLTPEGWRVLGDGRGGRNPRVGAPVHPRPPRTRTRLRPSGGAPQTLHQATAR